MPPPPPPPPPLPPCPDDCVTLFHSGACPSCNHTACLLLPSCSPLLGSLGQFIESNQGAGRQSLLAMSFAVGVSITALVLLGLFSVRRLLTRKAAQKGMYTFGEADTAEDLDEDRP